MIQSWEPIERHLEIQEAWKLGNLEVWRLGGLEAREPRGMEASGAKGAMSISQEPIERLQTRIQEAWKLRNLGRLEDRKPGS